MQDATGKVISWRVARVPGFGFDFLWYSRLLHKVCVQGAVVHLGFGMPTFWSLNSILCSLSLQEVVGSHFFLPLNARRDNKLSLSFIMR